MKTALLAIASATALFGSALFSAPANAQLRPAPMYIVTCNFEDGTSWWGATPNHVTATRMVSRCEGVHGGTASFTVGIVPAE